MESKICSKCKRELPYNMFCKCKTYKDGYDYWCKECKREQYVQNKEKRLKYQKDYYKNHPEVNEKFEKKHKERLTKYRKDYFSKNKEKILSYNKNYVENRIKTDDFFKFKQTVRSLIYQSFRRGKGIKKCPTREILGCEFEEFRTHLNNTFFDNYGYEYDGKEDVHIDHIIPLATAKTEEDVKRLCHYTNLQLLKASDNLKKSAKV